MEDAKYIITHKDHNWEVEHAFNIFNNNYFVCLISCTVTFEATNTPNFKDGHFEYPIEYGEINIEGSARSSCGASAPINLRYNAFNGMNTIKCVENIYTDPDRFFCKVDAIMEKYKVAGWNVEKLTLS